MYEAITARQRAEVGGDQKVYLNTAWGLKQVTGINAHSWEAHCGRDNGGFGMTYAITPQEPLYLVPDDQLDAANAHFAAQREAFIARMRERYS